nr:PIN domain-containing protein [Candidatus Sigynarchaeota archaeon]
MILVDTTVLVDVERGREEINEILQKYKNDNSFVISSLTLYELYAGIGYTLEKLGVEASRKKEENITRICDDYSIIDLSQDMLIRAGAREGELFAKGITVDMEDIIIGITAEVINADSLITRNPDHFNWCSVRIITYSLSKP